ncbi:L-aspartate aminotransferase [Scopulibacillus darangshiensis]|uniref:Aminotransferase n=1 Tax=Scopulibacillus darangshiensis TaxID=442528 RepID=A0A4R2PB39_9BACL|nr:pyridoxal phosphate-dependent aminotransferase [Scopulibacillus darangshiensis]TCP31608.1 L-aspartate aminotransferase [Scopulibacillus darangshiensis]
MELARRVTTITPSTTLAITAMANELLAEGHDVIGLAAGEPDFNTPEHIIEAAMTAVKNGETKYTPSGGLPALKQAIIEKLKKDQHLDYSLSNIIVTTGAKHALYLLFQACLNPGDEVIIPAPYWVSYPEQVKLAGGMPVIVDTCQENHFKVTVDQLQKALTDKTKAIIINSPSNPTGMIYTKEELRDIGDFCLENGLVIVSDEIYEKLVYEGTEYASIAQCSKAIKKQTVIINGVSKSHSMTGWRIGYAAGDEGLIKAMTNLASHSTSNPASASQHAAIAAYEGTQKPVEEMRLAFQDRLNYAYERLINIPGLTCVKPQGAFYLFANAKKAADMTGFNDVSSWLSALLSEEKVALVPGKGFGAKDYIRLSYATSLENLKEALDRINQFMEKHLS